MVDIDNDDSDEDGDDMQIKDENGETRKMTDEEKRKNFLERNRFVALDDKGPLDFLTLLQCRSS